MRPRDPMIFFCVALSFAVLTIGASAADPIEIYGHLRGKTVLHSQNLPSVPPFSDMPEPTGSKTNEIAKLESLFAARTIAVVEDGPHFVRLVSKWDIKEMNEFVPLQGADLARNSQRMALLKGSIAMINAKLEQVFALYADLSDRTVLQSTLLGDLGVTLKTESVLSKPEAAYAIRTILELSGLAVINDGEKFVQIVQTPARDQVRTNAPKPQPGTKTIDPKRVPSMLPDSMSPRLSPTEKEFKKLEKAFFEFINYKGPPNLPAKRLLQLYAKVADKTAESSGRLDARKVWLHVKTPVTKEELMYAIETTFRLNGLAIVPSGEDRVKLSELSERNKP